MSKIADQILILLVNFSMTLFHFRLSNEDIAGFYWWYCSLWNLMAESTQMWLQYISILDIGILPLVQILKLGNSKSSRICNFILQRHIRGNCGYGVAASNGFSDGGDLLQLIYKHWLRYARVNTYQSHYQLTKKLD